MEACSYKSPQKKRDIRLTSSLKQDPVEGASGSWKIWKSVSGKQASSVIRMSKARPAFGLYCGKCSHNPPRRHGHQPMEASSPSTCEASRNTGRDALHCPSTSQCTTAVPFFRVTHPSPCVLPQLPEVSLTTTICICGAWAQRGQVTYPRTRSY